MRNNIFILVFLSILALTSCEEVIEIDTKEQEPAVVIEAAITDRTERQTIYLSQTVPFNQSFQTVPIRNATVRVTETGGPTLTFTEDQPGVYRSIIFKGGYGKTYNLSVTVNGKTYTATSKMPNKVTLDSLSVSEVTFFGETRKYVKVHYQDPAQEVNAYNYVISINSKKINNFYVDSDRFNNGNYIENTIFTDDPEIVSGDEIMIDFQNITPEIYRYFFAITQIGGNGGPPVSPANPDTNLSNGALGYFSTHTSDKIVFRVR
ncbi:DUF4249 domain-containing protein [Pedobacter aquae]|uniref:DUF4249 domain-containing protein n=1 Tax=Pedobacter aquae TaxID=2605747 RepID=A0A5C0VHD5_9SPHI|nr:DUF4249 domain-containing protein [Pedobacter aquae]QEK51469.1 DUF4249 domain-containing protein [Pedobacter aquae]